MEQNDEFKNIVQSVLLIFWGLHVDSAGKQILKLLAEQLGLIAKDINRIFLTDSDIVEEYFKEDKPPVHYLERLMIKELIGLSKNGAANE